MNINKTNYGAWFIDYFEGTLSAEKTAELFLFLEQHPELKAEFEAFTPVSLENSEVEFPYKNLLKKDSMDKSGIDHLLIAEMEGDLSREDRKKLQQLIVANPSVVNERSLFRMTKLQPELVVFENKKSLKKKEAVVRSINIRIWTAAAAVIILILGLLYINRPGDREERAHVAPSITHPADDSLRDFFKGSERVKEDASLKQVAENEPKIEEQNNVTATPAHPKKNIIKNTPSAIERDNITLAEKRSVSIPAVVYNANVVNVDAGIASVTFENKPKETVKDKLNDIKDLAAVKVNNLTGEEILYTSEVAMDAAESKIPFKSRFLKLTAWAVGKISNNKVKMETTFDQSGNLASYQVSAGKFKYEKEF